MELRLQTGGASLAFLVIIFGICVNGHTLRDEACESISNSSCACFNGDSEFELECPRGTALISLRVRYNHAEIECNINSNRRIYTFFPDIRLSNLTFVNIDSVKFKNCPLPEGTTIKGVLVDKLGIDRIQILTFSSRSDYQMRREQLSNLHSLRNLRFNGPISDLPEDTFDDVSNITSLELRSTNVHLPLNIFQNLHELEHLELSSNNLSHLASGIFRNQHKLKRLSLWSNNLRNLTKESFNGATSVTELDLSSNNIEMLQTGVFDHFKDMENINLNSNRFIELPVGLFNMNKKLRKFRLVNNRVDLKTLPPAFLAGQMQLEEVLIRCNLQYLPGDLFNESTSIRNISLHSNRLATLPDAIFYSQTNLLNVDLSENQLTELPDHLFSNSKNVLVIRLSYNNLREISERLFYGLTQLTDLYLDNNRLTTIHRTAFKYTHLQVLNLENNHLDFRKFDIANPHKDPATFSPFEHTKYLIRLNLRNNSIKHFLDEWNLHNAALEVLDLSYNQISSLHIMQITAIWNQPITVNVSHNHITTILSDELDYAIIQNSKTHLIVDTQPNILWRWILNYNPIECDCQILYFVKLLRENPTIEKYLKLQTDDLKCDGPTNLMNHSIDTVNLDELLCPLDSAGTSTKYCPWDCKCWIRAVDKTGIFDCSNAGLTEVPTLPVATKESALKRLKKYELNIANNRIGSLPNRSEPGYELVVKLNARNNSLKYVGNEHLPFNITAVDVSQNDLATLDGKLLMRLNSTGTLEELILAGNPWLCKCESDFIKYVRLHPAKVDYQNITCKDGGYMHDKSEVCPMDRTLIILACVLVGLLGLFIGAVIALYYKYQQEVKVWLFAHNLCLWFVSEEELDKDKKYDAFISFSHKDEDFVTEQLVPELETGPHPFKICLHFRDWVVGEFIPNQISKSVEDSRRTIVVLTPNFIDSIWGRMEFRAAHKNALAEGRTRLIVVIYGDIGDIEKLDPELKVYLKTNTYVKWGDPWFFDKLRYALPHPTNYKSKGLIKSTMKSSIDDKLELIKPQAVTPPLTTPPAEQAGQNPLIGKLNGENAKYHSGLNGLNGHVNGAFIINTNAKQSDV